MSLPAEPAGTVPPKEDPGKLVLRGSPRPAIRFRRGLIAGIAGTVSASLIGLSWMALEPVHLHSPAGEPDSDEAAASPAAATLAGVPHDYADVPKLGPPLPGDLGRPILESQRSPEGAPAESAGLTVLPHAPPTAAQAERDAEVQARRSAPSSPVLVSLDNGAAGPQRAAEREGEAVAAEAAPAGMPRELGQAEPGKLVAPSSPWTLSAGTVIPASLITGLNSDLPGIVLAQVTENIRDTATGRTILVPQGARLIGRYDRAAAFGQRRAMLVWTRIVFPDGSSLGLGEMPAADASGYAGVADDVDSHSWQLLKGIAVSALLGVGTELSLGGEGDIVRAVRESAQQNAADAGDLITTRTLDIKPTIMVRPGWPVRAIVSRDLVLRPWRG